MRVPPPTTLVLLLSIALGGVFSITNLALAEDDVRFAAPIPTVVTLGGATYTDVVVVNIGPARFTFQHLGGMTGGGDPIAAGVASVPWTDLTDVTRTRVTNIDFAEGNSGFGETFPVIKTIDGADFRDVVVVAADPLRFTFRHLGGTLQSGMMVEAGVASLPWEEVSLEIRKQFNFMRQGPERQNTIPRMQTSKGTTYNRVVVLRTEPDGLTFRFAGGATLAGEALLRGAAKLPFEQLPDEVRRLYGFKQRYVSFRPDTLITSDGTVYRNPSVVRTDSRFLTFRHLGGTDSSGTAFVSGAARLPFETLPDDVRRLYDFKQQAQIGYNPAILPMLSLSTGTKYNNVRILRNEPNGLTFRHDGGTTSLGTAITPGVAKVVFEQLPDELRLRYDYKEDLARDFVRRHTPPAPQRRFVVVRTGHVPGIATGQHTPGIGVSGGVPAVGSRGFTPAIGFSGRVPAIGGGAPAMGVVAPPPAMGGGFSVPSIGAGFSP